MIFWQPAKCLLLTALGCAGQAHRAVLCVVYLASGVGFGGRRVAWVSHTHTLLLVVVVYCRSSLLPSRPGRPRPEQRKCCCCRRAQPQQTNQPLCDCDGVGEGGGGWIVRTIVQRRAFNDMTTRVKKRDKETQDFLSSGSLGCVSLHLFILHSTPASTRSTSVASCHFCVFVLLFTLLLHHHNTQHPRESHQAAGGAPSP
jgi:hypothetical protein